MYRCYLVRAGRIAVGYDLNADTIDEAIALGRRLLAAQPESEHFSGVEIWHRARLLYSDDCYADNARGSGLSSAHFKRAKARWSPPGVRPSPTFSHDSIDRHERIPVALSRSSAPRVWPACRFSKGLSATQECHLYFAHRVTFLTCADVAARPRGITTEAGGGASGGGAGN
jgi:hypothetical protein